MNSLSYILRILAIASGIAAAIFYFTGKGKLVQKQVELEEAQKTTASYKTELEAVSAQVADFEKMLSVERDDLALTKRNIENIRSEMHTAQQEAKRSKQQLQQARKKITEAENDARLLREELLKVEQSLAAAGNEGEIGQLNARISELTKANNALREQLNTAESAASSLARGSEGKINVKIVSIDRQKGMFVVEALPTSGLVAGRIVALEKSGQSLGKAHIIKIADNLAALNILSGASAQSLTTGGTVQILK
ncbi:MAG: hypothetical protein AAF546_08665 [Verrucomicrobiota bacterium]